MSSSMRNWAEKRDFIRMSMDAPIRITTADSTRTIQGVCKDLSGTGLSIEVAEPVPTGETLQVYLASPNANLPSFEAQVQVVRCTPLADQQFLLGVEILQIN